VPADIADPADRVVVLIGRKQREAGDRRLATHLVGVEELERDRLAPLDRARDIAVKRIVGVPKRPLPQPHIAGRDVQVPRLGAQLVLGEMLDR
jgi:hypothetical protein